MFFKYFMIISNSAYFHTILKHFLFNMYLDLVYQLDLLVHDKIRPCALDFHFF